MVVRVGIVGLGSIGATHAACLAELGDEAQLVAYSSQRTVAPEVLAIGNARRMEPEAVLAASDVDLVVISGPSNLHGVHAVAALQAGKHVVVEKPMATTAAAARDVVAAWREAGVMGSVIAQRRLESQHVELKRLLDGSNPDAIGIAGHLTQWRDVLAAVRTGRQPAISLADGLDVVELIDAIYAADATGVRQRVGEQ